MVFSWFRQGADLWWAIQWRKVVNIWVLILCWETSSSCKSCGTRNGWFGEKLCCSLNHLCCSSQCLGSLLLMCQCKLSLFGCDLSGLQAKAAQLKSQMWFFPMRSFVRHQYLKTEKQTKGSGLRGKERSLVWQIKHHSPERISVFQPKTVTFLLIRLIGKSVNNSLFSLKSHFSRYILQVRSGHFFSWP